MQIVIAPQLAVKEKPGFFHTLLLLSHNRSGIHLEVMEQLQPLFSCFSQIKGIFFSQIFGLQSLQKNSKCGRRQQ